MKGFSDGNRKLKFANSFMTINSNMQTYILYYTQQAKKKNKKTKILLLKKKLLYLAIYENNRTKLTNINYQKKTFAVRILK